MWFNNHLVVLGFLCIPKNPQKSVVSQIVLGWAFCLFFKSLWFCVFTIFSLLVLFLLNHQIIGRGMVWREFVTAACSFWVFHGSKLDYDYLLVSEGCFGHSNALDLRLPWILYCIKSMKMWHRCSEVTSWCSPFEVNNGKNANICLLHLLW